MPTDPKYVVSQPKPPTDKNRDTGTGRGRTAGEYNMVNGQTRYPYPYPEGAAEAFLANTPEYQLPALKMRLYNGGFYGKGDPPTGETERTMWDVTALRYAMQQANLNGLKWEEEADNRSLRVKAGLVGQFWGEPGSRYQQTKQTISGNLTITNKKDARENLDAKFKAYLGREATDREFTEFYNLLNKQELDPKNARTATARVIGGKIYQVNESPNINAADVAEGFVFTKMNLSDPKLSGTALETLNFVKNVSQQYGVDVTADQRAQFTKKILSGTMTEDNLKSTFADIAKQQYKGLASVIDNTMSVRQAASTYIQQYANTLEIDPDTVKLSDISNAISGDKLMPVSEFVAATRRDPRFQYTSQAKNEASSLADGFLKAFGFGG